MREVKLFHKCFLLMRKPNFRVPGQGILRQLPDGRYASCELELTNTPLYSDHIITEYFHIFLTQYTVMEVVSYRYSAQSLQSSIKTR